MTAILHLHIPRTAGSSFDTEIRAALPDKLCVAFTSMQRLQEIKSEHSEIAFLSGHFTWGVHKLFDDYLYVIILRDPIERVMSVYDYARSSKGHPRQEFFSTFSLKHILSNPKSERSLLSNGMVRQICGAETVGIPVNRFHLERAWEILCRPDVIVGFSDNLDDVMGRLSERIGISISTARKRNVSKRSPRDGPTIELIADRNRWDMELYRRALARFRGAGNDAYMSA